MALSKRVEKLERAARLERTRLVHVEPGQTVKSALAAHKRNVGPIPVDAAVVLIQHSFISAI